MHCNKCGNTLTENDNFKLDYSFNYFSKHDLDRLELALCNNCLDNTIDKLVKECRINPIVEYKPPVKYDFKLLFKDNEIIPLE